MTRDPIILHGDDDSEFEIVDDTPFFAPVSSDVLDGLLGQYITSRRHIEQLAGIVMGGEFGNVCHYFITGNCGDDQLHRSLYVDKLFRVEGAVAALNSAYWSKALALTDVYACMPQERKNEWNKQLRHPEGVKMQHRAWDSKTHKEWESEPLPNFEAGTVRSTIEALLLARSQFLAERVDGIFRALSGHHVTNAPEAFGKRMIVAHIIGSYGSANHERVGYLHDLRMVIAKFMGRGEPVHQGTTNDLVDTARAQHGKWVVADGGALKIRVYKIGTAHLEVHPEMAWRLNSILAHMHPFAIPAEFRQKPKRRPKEVAMLNRPLPFAVLELIARMRKVYEPRADGRGGTEIPMARAFDHGDHDKHVLAEATRVVESIGGVKTRHFFTFDYEPGDVLREIATSGCVPDVQSHQFYPSPEIVAQAAVDLAEIGDADECCEPQAGHGDLAAFMPKDRTLCIELSALRCSVLKSRGFNTLHADFLEWAATTSQRFDCVISNPPFSEGRWLAHTEAAATILKPGGRLVAVLPMSAKGKSICANGIETWGSEFRNEFAGTSVSVILFRYERPMQ